MAAWNGAYMRYNLKDDGFSTRSGTLSGSPDLIPFGRGPASEAEVKSFIDSLWMTDRGTSTTSDVRNYLYLRGANTSDVTTEGEVYLYYSPSRLLNWPWGQTGSTVPGWAERPLELGDGSRYLTMRFPRSTDREGRWVTRQPFLWKAEQPLSDHYCLVGRISTPQKPNDIPKPTDVDAIRDFALYVSKHPDISWRNVETLVPKGKIWEAQNEYTQGVTDSPMCFRFVVTGGRKGDTVSVNARTSGPVPSVSKTETVTSDTEPTQITIWTTVPAKWSSIIDTTYQTTNNQPLPARLESVFTPFMVPASDDDELLRYARSARDLSIPDRPDGDPGMLVPVGSMHYAWNVPSP